VASLALLLALSGCVGTAVSAGGGCPGSGQLTATFAQQAAAQRCFLSNGGGSSGALTDTGNPTADPQWLSVSVTFGNNDLLTGKLCEYETGSTFPLTTGCIALAITWTTGIASDAGGQVQWAAYAGQPNLSLETDPTSPLPTGVLTLEQWPDSSGGPISVSLSDDAALTSLNNGQIPSFLIPLAGSATGAE
jgi:hypothetical protein